MATEFIRMNGLGNDFLIYDARGHALHARTGELKNQGTEEKEGSSVHQFLSSSFPFNKEEILNLCSRKNKHTKGCDQLIVLTNSQKADVGMLVYNADASEVYACGNASRCVISLMSAEGKSKASIETKAAILNGEMFGKNMVSVDMGKPVFDWKKIPLASDVDTKNLPIELAGFDNPFAVSMGNPHMVFTTNKDVEQIDVKGLGAPLEHHKLFPERANVGFAQIVDRTHINLRVFERGAGETLACGTGACAAAVAAISRNLVDRKVNIKTHGGPMVIEWRESDSHVIMTGPVELEGKVSV